MTRVSLVLLALGLSAQGLMAQESSPSVSPTLKTGARIRAQMPNSSGDDAEWFTGIVRHNVEGCGLLVLDDFPSRYARPDGTVVTTFQRAVALQVSSLYDGDIDPKTYRQRDYAPGKSLKGEEWLDVNVDSLKAAEPAECSSQR